MMSDKTKEKTMEKSRKYFWAVFQGRDVLFEGSFKECWQHLVDNYCNSTVRTLVEQGIRVGRKG